MATTETRKMVLAAAAVCEEKKGENTRVLELDPADSGFTDFFLITSGNNPRQTVAIADDIELKLKREFSIYANSVEGRRAGEWILMDYVDFVVHIFVEEKRAFYDIERLRKSARPVDLIQLKAALTDKTATVRRRHPRPSETDPEPSGARVEEPEKKTKGGKKAAPRKIAVRKTASKKKAAPIVPRGTIVRRAGSAGKAAPEKKSPGRIAPSGASSQVTSKKKSAREKTGSLGKPSSEVEGS